MVAGLCAMSMAIAVKSSSNNQKRESEKKKSHVNRFQNSRGSSGENKKEVSTSNTQSTNNSWGKDNHKSIKDKVVSNQLDNSSMTAQNQKNPVISNNETKKHSPKDTVAETSNSEGNNSSVSTKVPTKSHLDSNNKISQIIDSSNSLIANKADSVKKRKHRGIALVGGLGLNVAFPIAGQNRSGLNANGSNNILTDYIPIPMLRIYLHKKVYLQMEAQFKAPQFTKNLIIKSTPIVDSVGNSWIVTSQDSGVIKKLFYFNLPISFHYSLSKSLAIGVGLQYAHLTNGESYYQTSRDSSLNGYSIFRFVSYKNGSLKNSNVYKSLLQNEFRFMIDVNEHWKNLELGLAYNQALNRFINLKITNSIFTQATNSSLQFYLRYILWKNKKAKELSSK